MGNIFEEEQKAGRKLARALLKPINTAAVVILGLLTTAWGFWIANPWWSVFGTAQIYEQMQKIAPELWWGSIAMLVGVLMIYGVVKHSYASLAWGAAVGFYHWLAISVLVFIGDWQNTAGLTYSFISIYCAFIWLNIRINRENLQL